MSLGAFLAASLALLLTPGPAVAFVVARSLSGGRRAGLVSQLGLCTGLLVHVAAATLGLSAVIARSTVAFSTLKYLGAAYLLWLGIRALTTESSRAEPEATTPAAAVNHRRLFLDGFLVDALNPKPALFFLALLPQFVDPAAGAVPWQLALLGLLFVLLALVTGTAYALLAGSLAPHLHRWPHLRTATRWTTSSTYLALAGLTAWDR